MFISLFGPYERLFRYEEEGRLIVSTVQNSDADSPYETAISHPLYHDGKWVVVEEYNELDNARAGHDRWIEVMTADILPESLRDVSSSQVAKLNDEMAGDVGNWRVRQKAQKGGNP